MVPRVVCAFALLAAVSATQTFWMLSVLLSALLFVGFYCRASRRLAKAEPAAYPSVSIIVPMRNEERNAQACLDSLSALRYPNYEVLAVDDGSTDRTSQVVQEWLQRYRGSVPVRALRIGSAPAGWVGKTYAADCGIKQSSGELILITDADIVHGARSLTATVAAFQERGTDALSRIPHVPFSSAGNIAASFLFFLLLFSSWVARLLGGRPFVPGAYVLFSRDFYVRTGGWAANRSFPETLALVQCGISHGMRYRILDDGAAGALRSNMYPTLGGASRAVLRNTHYGLMPLLGFCVFFTALALMMGSAFLLAFFDAGSLKWWGGAAGAFVFSGAFALHLFQFGYAAREALMGAAAAFPAAAWLSLMGVAALVRQAFNLPLDWRGKSMRIQ